MGKLSKNFQKKYFERLLTHTTVFVAAVFVSSCSPEKNYNDNYQEETGDLFQDIVNKDLIAKLRSGGIEISQDTEEQILNVDLIKIFKGEKNIIAIENSIIKSCLLVASHSKKKGPFWDDFLEAMAKEGKLSWRDFWDIITKIRGFSLYDFLMAMVKEGRLSREDFRCIIAKEGKISWDDFKRIMVKRGEFPWENFFGVMEEEEDFPWYDLFFTIVNKGELSLDDFLKTMAKGGKLSWEDFLCAMADVQIKLEAGTLIEPEKTPENRDKKKFEEPLTIKSFSIPPYPIEVVGIVPGHNTPVELSEENPSNSAKNYRSIKTFSSRGNVLSLIPFSSRLKASYGL